MPKEDYPIMEIDGEEALAEYKAPPPPEPITIDDAMIQMARTAGTIDLPADKLDKLFAPVDPELVEIREDGIIYYPWMEYAKLMRDAFGLKWVMVPQGEPKREGNLILWGFYLVIDGVYMGYAVGEQTYYPNNRTMTWGDACEGAKSNALTRLAKSLGISLELWQPEFIRNWKDKYAVQVAKGSKKVWVKRHKASEPQPPMDDTGTPTPEPVPAPKLPKGADELNAEIHKVASVYGKDHNYISDVAADIYGVSSMTELTLQQQRGILIKLYAEMLDMEDKLQTMCNGAGIQGLTEQQTEAILRMLRRESARRNQNGR